jgi:ADP-ribose diphosphatase
MANLSQRNPVGTVQMTKDDLPVILESHCVARTSLFEIETSVVRFSNGVERRLELLKQRSAGTVLVVPLLDNDTIIFIREYCAGIHSYELVFPTGTINEGEMAEEAAQRELKEEVGYGANSITRMSVLKIFPGHSDHRTHVFLAKALYPARLVGDEPEAVKIATWPLSALDTLIESEQVSEVRSLTALLLLQRGLTSSHK